MGQLLTFHRHGALELCPGLRQHISHQSMRSYRLQLPARHQEIFVLAFRRLLGRCLCHD